MKLLLTIVTLSFLLSTASSQAFEWFRVLPPGCMGFSNDGGYCDPESKEQAAAARAKADDEMELVRERKRDEKRIKDKKLGDILD